MVICLFSTLSCPLLFAVHKYNILLIHVLNDSPYDLTIIFLIDFALTNSNYLLIQTCEEMCLLIMSKDFQKLVKNQFVRNTQNNVVVATVHVAQASQQQGRRQVNIMQRNNLANIN